ncbi:MAG TPA: hypothetical protein GX396_01260 [Tissierellia bacterium]|nr:hypothetical protein [Tissierellia bacterium]
MKRTFKVLNILLILVVVFTLNDNALAYEAGDYEELENIVLEQMRKYNPNFKINYTGSLDNIEEVLKNILKKDIYVNSNVSKVGWEITSNRNSSNININVSYIITPQERMEADKKIDEILSHIIKPYMNDHEKVKAVHDYIVLRGKYDTSFTYYSDYDLLVEGTSVCNGYALLTYNMLNKLNIPVKLVSGTAEGENHIWNMVKLGTHWFHLDTSWNDPLPDKGNISYKYYMLTEKEISMDHTIDEELNIPKSTKRYYDYLKELSYDKLLAETGLDMYDEVNTAKSETELISILSRKIKYRPLKISVRFDKSITQDGINNGMSQLLRNDYISVIEYCITDSDNTGEWSVLDLFIKYKETPEKIIVDFPKKVYNIASEVNFRVYAQYGDMKTDITKDVLIYPYDRNKLNVYNGTLKFKEAGNYNLLFEFQGLNETVSITGLNSEAFKYITDKKPDNYVNVKVYDQYIDFSSVNQWPIIEKGRTMVPLRAVFEVLNCNVKWEESTKSAVVEFGSTKIIIPADSTTAYINGKINTLDVPAKIVNNRIMVPLRFVSEAIDKTVIWDDENKTVLIY